MGKPAKLDPVSPESIHKLFPGARATKNFIAWEAALKTFLQTDILTKSHAENRSDEWAQFLCKDPNLLKCEEVQKTAAVFFDNDVVLASLTRDISAIRVAHKKEFVRNYVSDEGGPSQDYSLDYYAAIIPYVKVFGLRDIADSISGLAAMERLLKECPQSHANHKTAYAFFININSKLADRFTSEERNGFKSNNTLLWFNQPLSSRIALGLKSHRAGEIRYPWDVMKVRGDDALEEVQAEKKSKEDKFAEELGDLKISARAKGEDEGEDDTDAATLVDVR